MNSNIFIDSFFRLLSYTHVPLPMPHPTRKDCPISVHHTQSFSWSHRLSRFLPYDHGWYSRNHCRRSQQRWPRPLLSETHRAQSHSSFHRWYEVCVCVCLFVCLCGYVCVYGKLIIWVWLCVRKSLGLSFVFILVSFAQVDHVCKGMGLAYYYYY